MTIPRDMLRSIATPEQLETLLGTLYFVDGFPSPETSELVRAASTPIVGAASGEQH